jgi:hypothetical protein
MSPAAEAEQRHAASYQRRGKSIIGSRAGLRYRENAKILSRFERDLRASTRAQCLELLQRPEFVTRIP